VVESLLARETLSGDEIRMIMRGEELPPKPEPEPEPEPEPVKPKEEVEGDTEPSVGGEQPQIA
jgi:hypothetical protein